MISRIELTIIWREHRGRIWKCSSFSSVLGLFSKGSLAGTKKKCMQEIFKSWSPTDYILGYNTWKIETNNENGIKMCQTHKNFKKSGF